MAETFKAEAIMNENDIDCLLESIIRLYQRYEIHLDSVHVALLIQFQITLLIFINFL